MGTAAADSRFMLTNILHFIGMLLRSYMSLLYDGTNNAVYDLICRFPYSSLGTDVRHDITGEAKASRRGSQTGAQEPAKGDLS